MARPNHATLPLLLSATLVAVAGSSGACGESGTPPARTGGDTAATEAPRQGTAPLVFAAKTAGAKPFPFALVQGKIGDQPTWFLVDTGAAVHTVDRAVANAAKLAVEGAVVRAPHLAIDGWGSVAERGAAVAELPAPLRAHGVGGIVAPQLLPERGQAVVVDLVNRQLRERPRSTAWSEIEALGVVLTPPGQRACPAAGAGGLAGLLLAVDATIDGEAGRLAIDTGASRTVLVEGSKVAERAATRPTLGRTVLAGASGDTAASIHGGVPFTLGAWSRPIETGVMPGARHPQCGHDGRLGIDVLQHCAIAMTAEELVVACRAADPR